MQEEKRNHQSLLRDEYVALARTGCVVGLGWFRDVTILLHSDVMLLLKLVNFDSLLGELFFAVLDQLLELVAILRQVG